MNTAAIELDAEELKTIKLKDLTVYYTPDLDGGGIEFGQDYIYYLRDNFTRPLGRAFEFCAGPGFIGFGLLAHGLCESLCLADINPKAIAVARKTIEVNGLSDRVSLYQSDCLADVPASERWDVVVGNPPHSGTDLVIPEWGVPELIYQDIGWSLHRRFYQQVTSHLNPNGIVLLQEAYRFTTAETFREMIEGAGLGLVKSETCISDPRKFYVWSELNQ